MSIRIAFLQMFASRAVALVLMATGFAVLGRLLPPSAFGHYALAFAIYGVFEIVGQFGLRQFLVRSDEAPRELIETAAGLSLAISSVLFVLCLAIGLGGGGWLLPKPAAAALVPMAFILLVRPFVLGTEALLQRALDFDVISLAEVIRIGADVTVAITLATLGFEAMALALGMCASHLTLAAMLLLWGGRANRVRPRIGAWRGFAAFGGRLTAVQVLPRVSDLIMASTLSAGLGATALGLFNRAQIIHKILDRILFEGVDQVVLPAFTDGLKRGAAPMRLYLVTLDYMAAICWPSFAMIALMAEPLVAVMLGSQWNAAVPVVRILALMGLTIPFTKLSHKLFVALDETGAALRVQLVEDAVRVPLAVLGAMISLEAFAAAFVAGNIAKALAITRSLHRRHGRIERGYAQIFTRNAAVALATLAGPAIVLALDLGAIPSLVAALLTGAVSWLAALALTRHGLFAELRAGIADLAPAIARR